MLKKCKEHTSQKVSMKKLYTSLCSHTHTLNEPENNIKKITLLKSKVGIYKCQLKSIKNVIIVVFCQRKIQLIYAGRCRWQVARKFVEMNAGFHFEPKNRFFLRTCGKS